MKRRNDTPHYSRRDAIRLGAAAIGFTALARPFSLFADDVISKAKIVASGGTVSGAKYKKTGRTGLDSATDFPVTLGGLSASIR
jgi:hypothetical protein